MTTVQQHVCPEIFQEVRAAAEEYLAARRHAGLTFLITGGSGFIARHLVLTLLAANDLYGLNNTAVLLCRSEKNARKAFGPLLDRPDCRLLLQDVCLDISPDAPRFDHVIHAASPAEAGYFEAFPVEVFNSNVLGMQSVLRRAKKDGCASVVFLSSFTVYGDTRNTPLVDESHTGADDWRNLRAAYSCGKRAAEFLCFAEHGKNGVPVRIVRPGFVYGASSAQDSRVYAEIIACAARSEPVILRSAGHVHRSMVHVSDTARAVFAVLFSGVDGEAYNVAAEHVSIREFAFAAARAVPSCRVSFSSPEDENAPFTGTVCGRMSTEKIRLACGWTPSVPLEAGIRSSAAVFRRLAGLPS